MKAFFSILLLVVFTLGCSQDPAVENFKLQVSPAEPPIIFQTFEVFDVFGEEIVTQEITGPWMRTGFSVVNNFTETITIVAVEIRVTAQDGQTRIAQLFFDFNRDPGLFGVFRAEGDINCDGIVDVLDATASEPADCELDDINPSFNSELAYIFDLLEGTEGTELDPFRGSSFDFEMRLEGWVGSPLEPKEGFFKVVNFTVSSNGG